MTQSKAAATKRLLRDLREWKNCGHQAKCITAAPLENDIFEWHVNFIPDCGPLKDIIFHLVMIFPDNYPLHHPYVTLKNYLNHPNVFRNGEYGHHTKCGTGYWICLDMIKCCNWSAAYSVSSILMQLLSFLITAKAPQDYGADKIVTHSNDQINEMLQESMQFKCNRCNHSFKEPYPAPYQSSIIAPSNNAEIIEIKSLETDYWTKYMHQDVENIVINFLNIGDLLLLSKVNRRMKKLVFKAKSFRMGQFSCWYHKVDLRYSEFVRTQNKNSNIDDPVASQLILGYGINVTFFNQNSSYRQFKSYFSEFRGSDSNLADLVNDKGLEFPTLRECETTFDLLSRDAFEIGNIHRTPMNDKTFSFWIPMYFIHNKFHGIESLNILKQYTLKVFQSSNPSITKYHPFMSVHLICTIMSSLVVKLMEAIRSKKLHHSINVLVTYFHFFHLLLAVYNKYYDILHPLIQQKCINFILNINLRHKNYVPSLGTFMIWFALSSNIPSNIIFKALLEEGLVRNQRWIIKKYGINYEQQSAANFELDRAFIGSLVSKRLFMFQYFFMKKICGLGIIKWSQQFKQLNDSLGSVDDSVSLQLQSFCKKLDQINDFPHFFGVLQMEYPGDITLKKWLRKAIDISAQRGYHMPSTQVIHGNDDEDDELNEAFESFDYLSFFEAVNKNDIDTVKKILDIKDCDDTKEHDIKMDDVDIKTMDIDNINWNALKINNCFNHRNNKTIIFDKNMTDKSGYCPLFIAANKGYIEMVGLLISADFNVHITDKNGKTAAEYSSNHEIIELIKKQQTKTQPIAPKNGFCASKYIQITGLPKEIDFDFENIRLIFKRYGFNANIKNECISFQQTHVLVKLREYKINDKMKNIKRCYCFGNKVRAKIYDLTELADINNVNIISSDSSLTPRSRFPGRIGESSSNYNSYYNNNGYRVSRGYTKYGRYNNDNNGYNNDYRNNYGHNNNNNYNRHSYRAPSRGYNGYNNNYYGSRNGNGY